MEGGLWSVADDGEVLDRGADSPELPARPPPSLGSAAREQLAEVGQVAASLAVALQLAASCQSSKLAPSIT